MKANHNSAKGEVYYMETQNGKIFVTFYKKDGVDAGTNIVNAIDKIKEGTKLIQHEEYAVETLWHEILHNKAKRLIELPPISSVDGFPSRGIRNRKPACSKTHVSVFFEENRGERQSIRIGYSKMVTGIR